MLWATQLNQLSSFDSVNSNMLAFRASQNGSTRIIAIIYFQCFHIPDKELHTFSMMFFAATFAFAAVVNGQSVGTNTLPSETDSVRNARSFSIEPSGHPLPARQRTSR